ncbi:unnamed protein product [Echinostoma caproni]|uniref:BAH domain-containing protein n=1 Tax=Echinostoma caproni TaxID=27848 RepID=A0A183BED9_9TREM|nr:unnamed protein product [Echinostoma caproni]
MVLLFSPTDADELSEVTTGDLITVPDEFRQLGEIRFRPCTADNHRFIRSSPLCVSRQASYYRFKDV